VNPSKDDELNFTSSCKELGRLSLLKVQIGAPKLLFYPNRKVW